MFATAARISRRALVIVTAAALALPIANVATAPPAAATPNAYTFVVNDLRHTHDLNFNNVGILATTPDKKCKTPLTLSSPPTDASVPNPGWGSTADSCTLVAALEEANYLATTDPTATVSITFADRLYLPASGRSYGNGNPAWSAAGAEAFIDLVDNGDTNP